MSPGATMHLPATILRQNAHPPPALTRPARRQLAKKVHFPPGEARQAGRREASPGRRLPHRDRNPAWSPHQVRLPARTRTPARSPALTPATTNPRAATAVRMRPAAAQMRPAVAPARPVRGGSRARPPDGPGQLAGRASLASPARDHASARASAVLYVRLVRAARRAGRRDYGRQQSRPGVTSL
jgi:hypothetical protein